MRAWPAAIDAARQACERLAASDEHEAATAHPAAGAAFYVRAELDRS